MRNLESSYTKILKTLHQVEPQKNFLSQIRTLKLYDNVFIVGHSSDFTGVLKRMKLKSTWMEKKSGVIMYLLNTIGSV